MKANALVQVLDRVYQRDLAKFTELKGKLNALDAKRAELQCPLQHDPQGVDSLELSGAASRYLAWRRSEAHKTSRMMFELHPEIIAAKKILTKSFGRFEAMKELIDRGEF